MAITMPKTKIVCTIGPVSWKMFPKKIELDGRFKNIGVQMAMEVASKTSDEAGDDTATIWKVAITLDGNHGTVCISFTMRQARGLADKAIKIDNEADTHRLLNRAWKAAVLDALVCEN